MDIDPSTLVATASVLVSGALGLVSLWLALRRRSDEDALARATRRTSALQLLSDEEFTLIRVHDECTLFRDAVARNRSSLGDHFEHFAAEAQRIVTESSALLHDVRARRNVIEPSIRTLSAAEIETIIATAYHGKIMADAQLQRTLASKAETLRAYEL